MYRFLLSLNRRFHTICIFQSIGLEYNRSVLIGIFHCIVKFYIGVRFKNRVIRNRCIRKYGRQSGNKVRIIPVIYRTPSTEPVAIPADTGQKCVDAVAGHSCQGRRCRRSAVCLEINAGIHLSVLVVNRYILVRHGSRYFSKITSRCEVSLKRGKYPLINGHSF